MLERGYSKGYITAVNCLTGLITATIPPSLGLIIYGFVGEVSIGRLFAAGIIPGILMMFTLMLTVNLTARHKKYDAPNPDTPKLTGKELLGGLKESVWALIFPVILIVGIRFGVCTPSEAGAFAVVYAILIGVFVYREMTFKSFCDALLMSMMDNAAVMMLVAMSGRSAMRLRMSICRSRSRPLSSALPPSRSCCSSSFWCSCLSWVCSWTAT